MSHQNSPAGADLLAAAAEETYFGSTDLALPAPIPPLENGDHLTRDEFERRYNAMHPDIRAELIEGIVYMPAAIRLDQHANPQGRLITWLGCYEADTSGTLLGGNASIRLDLDNEPQPDCLLLIEPDCGGQAIIDKDGYVERAPELVGEISASTVSIDLHTKFRVYLRNGVREYIVWRVRDREIDWFVLRAGKYERLTPDDRGFLRSESFPGLWLDHQALVRGAMKKVLAVLDEGLATDEHAAFVAKLQAARKPS